jgi:hypothetical protein
MQDLPDALRRTALPGTFLRGASLEELVAQARKRYAAFDECSLAGIVRAR